MTDPWVIAVVVLFVLNVIGWVGVLVLMASLARHRATGGRFSPPRYTAESARDKALQDVNKLQRKIDSARQVLK